tara:strand:- start:650 stop:793 length:144 start_codon:yes stop_codon:yes gene_type:complete
MSELNERETLIEFIKAHLELFDQDELNYFADYIITKEIDFRKKSDRN